MIADCRDVVPWVVEYYRLPGNAAGGECHIVLDDGNLGDDSIRFCLRNAELSGDPGGVLLMSVFLQMSMTQRKKVCRMFWEELHQAARLVTYANLRSNHSYRADGAWYWP